MKIKRIICCCKTFCIFKSSCIILFQVSGLTLRSDVVDLALMYLATVQALAVSIDDSQT